MLPIVTLVAGFAFGWFRAARRGGGTADRWQYAISHALAFGLLGFVISIFLIRSGLFGAA